MENLKKDFIYNLNLIKELESKVRQFDTNNSRLTTDLKLTQGQVSDEIIKSRKAQDFLDKKLQIIKISKTIFRKKIFLTSKS